MQRLQVETRTLIKYCTIRNFALITVLYATSYEQKWRSIEYILDYSIYIFFFYKGISFLTVLLFPPLLLTHLYSIYPDLLSSLLHLKPDSVKPPTGQIEQCTYTQFKRNRTQDLRECLFFLSSKL